LLTTGDYGILNLFSTYNGILAVIMTMNIHSVVGRYFYDKKSDEDFRNFVGTVFFISSFFILVFFIFFLLFYDYASNLLGLPKNTVIYLPILVITGIASSVFSQIMQPLNLSRKLAINSILYTYSAFVLSVILMLQLNTDKYMGSIWAQMAVGCIFFFYYIKEIRPFFNFSFHVGHLRYILGYSIPMIPYALSGVILAQIDRVMINSYQGVSSVGMYSFAYNIALLMSLVVNAIGQAWIPKYFQYMNDKEYATHDREIIKITYMVIAIAGALILFGKELGMLLAAKKFHAALTIIPVVVISYVFEHVFTIYGRNIGYSRRTIYATLIALSAGTLNIILNKIFLPKYGYQIAAWTTLASYLLMALLAYAVSRYIIKLHSTSLLMVLTPVLFLLPVAFLNRYIDNNITNFPSALLVKISVLGIFGFLMVGKDLKRWISRST